MPIETTSRPVRVVLLGAMVYALALPACGRVGQESAETGGAQIRDGLDRPLTLEREPRRLVSLAPSVTESLLSLGLGNRLVGITDFCELPDTSLRPARVGGMLNPNLESIRRLQPDLLIATTSGNDPSLASQAAGLGLPLFILHTPDVGSMLTSLRSLGRALGDPASGERLAASLEKRLAHVAQRTAGRRPPRVLFVIWHDPLVVPGREGFLTDAIRRAGGVSVTADASGAHPSFNLEAAIARSPEVILTTPENRSMMERLPDDPAWAEVPAVATRRIHILRPDIVRPGPGVVRGIEEMSAYLHPSGAAGD